MKLFVYRDGNKVRRVTAGHLDAARAKYAEGSVQRKNIDLILSLEIGHTVSLAGGKVTYTRVRETATDEDILAVAVQSIEAEEE